MTPREYLERPGRIRREISRKQVRIESLRRLSVSLAPVLSGSRVRSTPDPTRMQALLAAVTDEEREILRLEEVLAGVMIDTALYISGLPEPLLSLILEDRYVYGMRWEEITGRLGYTDSLVFKLHRRAVSLLPPPPEVPEDAFP